jgi:hypothetical protein
MSVLADRFPAIEKVGLGDGAFAGNVIDVLPPFLLFGFREVMDRVAGWENIPLDLADVYDEIDDPEAFSISFAEPSAAASRSATLSLQAESQTPTQRFCNRDGRFIDNPMDPVRLNRIKMAGFALKTAVDVWSGFIPESIGLDLVGFGLSGVPVFAKPIMQTIKGAIEVIQAGVETHRQNLRICRNRLREIESHLIECRVFLEYKRQPANDEAYAFVEAKVSEFDDVTTTWNKPLIKDSMNKAQKARSTQRYGEAYKHLCSAYQLLGQ